MEHFGTGLSYSEYTLIRLLYEDIYKPTITKFLKYETDMGAINILSLEKRDFIKVIDGELYLRDTALKIMQANKNNPRTRAFLLADKLREIFPEGKKGNMYHWRGSTMDIGKKLTKFIYSHPRYTNEQIIEATEQYVSGFSPMDMDTAMMLLKYFIEKNGFSVLLEFLENDDIKEEKVQRRRI